MNKAKLFLPVVILHYPFVVKACSLWILRVGVIFWSRSMLHNRRVPISRLFFFFFFNFSVMSLLMYQTLVGRLVRSFYIRGRLSFWGDIKITCTKLIFLYVSRRFGESSDLRCEAKAAFVFFFFFERERENVFVEVELCFKWTLQGMPSISPVPSNESFYFNYPRL